MDILSWPGKSAPDGGHEHPAVFHMLDVAAVAEILLDRHELPEPLRKALIFLVSIHDLGKIGEMFRDMIRSGETQLQPHWQVTEFYLNKHDIVLAGVLGSNARIRALFYAATAGHHGRPPDLEMRRADRLFSGRLRGGLRDVPDVVNSLAALWPGASLEGVSWEEAIQLSWWLPGLVSAADWIGSNTEWFPAEPRDLSISEYMVLARSKARIAVTSSGYGRAKVGCGRLFEFALRPMQLACTEIPLPEGPMLAVIEEETGAGKTEAAMLLAQRMLLEGKAQGIFMALPTMATSDAMFRRARETIGRLFTTAPTLTLAHGRAGLSEDYNDLRGASAMHTEDVTCTDWLADDRRRALLADVGVGTIDQALLSAVPTRFNTLRHFGLSSKLLIVDEVHEMGDPYMGRLLEELLRMHKAAGGSAILLTATLPLAQRRKLMEIYGSAPSTDAYPCLSLSSGHVETPPQIAAPKGDVAVQRIDATTALDVLAAGAAAGAACVWVRNAVDEAIAAVEALRARGLAADLLHARYTLEDRKRIETCQVARFGKDGEGRAGRILVATQVVESSLDLDFDVMVSDLAPMASLIQRAGRLWRHMDRRPIKNRPVAGPLLHVVSPNPADVPDERWLIAELGGGGFVYPLEDMWRTAHELFAKGRISAPLDLRNLIEAVHGEAEADLPSALDAPSLKSYGRQLSQRGLANQNVIRYADGYRNGGVAGDDRTYPTRLGVEQLVLVLARQEAGLLAPFSENGWAYSEVTASRKRLERLPLPNQNDPAVSQITRHWPTWKWQQYRLCIVDHTGAICEGLKYSADTGLMFLSSAD